MNDFEYLLNQLNLLIGFLDVSDEHIYNQIKQHDRFQIGYTIEQLYDYQYENYLNHITTSALILGFSHFEDYMTKCIAKILINHPAKNEIKVTIKTFVETGENSIAILAEAQSRRLTFSEKIKFIEKHLTGLSPQIMADIKYVNDLRNCLMHNNGFADSRLNPKYHDGQKIILTSGDVNTYGLQARQLAKEIWVRI